MDNNFKLVLIFELEKEHAIKSGGFFRKEMKEKYSLNDAEISILHRDITNFQVKKYGSNLTGCFIRERRR